ncbi:expressed unknown protein [Seminavis robusta]|uniref:Uncharacterized protein n=1 Tax=Seminavis robusta TaxID=568900 RepID=A0A9N8DA12_9STRA|nr:expressed unknown protein [Seminavis robusta]|eukprot:Sro30_g019490.1 n/a (1051) ;mRNA; r:42506-46036
MSSNQEDEPTQYLAPRILELVKGATYFPRGRYSTNFAHLVSQDPQVQEDYKDGLVALSCFLGGFFVIWGLVLIFLMIKGKSVGCASGRAFGSIGSGQQSTGSQKQPQDESHSSVHSEEEPPTANEYAKDAEGGEELETESFSSSLCSSDAASRFDSFDTSASFNDGSIDANHRFESPRATRTRIAFLVFACIVLACVPLALAFAFAPMKETTKSVAGQVEVIEDVLVQVRAALKTISTASESTNAILSQTNTNHSTFCPNLNNSQFDQTLAEHLQRLSYLIGEHFDYLDGRITGNTTELHESLDTVEDAILVIDGSNHQVEGIVWLVPGLLLAVSIVSALATFGVILAWKQDSGVRLQRCMSYGVLPTLAALCIMCVILAIATTVATAASSDFCLQGSSSGSPDFTVPEMLVAHGDFANSTKHQFFVAYTAGCTGPEPTRALENLERASQDTVDEIWTRISAVDSYGRSQVAEACGGSGLDEIMSAARNIAKLLTKVRRALDSASDSLACDRISPMYEATIHTSMCTNFAAATAWGSITFFILGTAIMVLISLRASWRVNIDEDRIYHHESEVAENMIVDEHEEYLRYISRYKHEWQEYNGFGSAGTSMSMKKSTSFSASEGGEDDLCSNYSESGSVSHTTDFTGRSEQDDATSIDSGDISFPSLNVLPTDDSSASAEQPLVPMPPPLQTTKRAGMTMSNSERLQQIPSILRRTDEEKSEDSDTNPGALSEMSEEESTDFSSIGRAARAGPSSALYWRHHWGLGAEVAMSSVSDSLVVSPNSNGEIDSFDLSKTPSPRRKTFLDVSGANLLNSTPGSDQSPPKPSEETNGSRFLSRTRTDLLNSTPGSDQSPPKPSEETNGSRFLSRTRTDPLPAASSLSLLSRTISANPMSRTFSDTQRVSLQSHFHTTSTASGISSLRVDTTSMSLHTHPRVHTPPRVSLLTPPRPISSTPRTPKTNDSSTSSGQQSDSRLSLTNSTTPVSVKFEEQENDFSSPNHSHVQQQVVHFSKTGPKVSERPKTPIRNTQKLQPLVQKFDPKSGASSEDYQTI